MPVKEKSEGLTAKGFSFTGRKEVTPMDKTGARDYCKAHTLDLLKPSKNGFYCCELCGSGLKGGAKSDGALKVGTKAEGHIHCFSCDFDGDIFDYIAQRDGVQAGTKENFNRVYELMGVTVDEYEKPKQEQKQPEQEEKPVQADYTNKYRAWAENIEQCEYLKQRGISLDIARKFWLGYGEIYFIGLEKKEKALIIPLSKNAYSGRNTNKATEQEQRYQKKGQATLFNGKALEQGNGYVIVTEGEIDALSIIQAGGNAIALGSTANLDLLIAGLKKSNVKGVILALDNDEAGQRATQDYFVKLKENKLNVPSYALNLYNACKDANELLLKSPKALEQNIKRAIDNPVKYEYEQENKSDYDVLDEFWERIHDSDKGVVYSTGFEQLDKALGGGIGTGLTCVGAIPALGKTTLITQIANNIANAYDVDILFFTLELGRDEIIAKTFSRLTAEASIQTKKPLELACSGRDILQGANWYKYPKEKQDLIYYAKTMYQKYARKIYTFEGDMEYKLDDIIAKVEAHTIATGRKVVIVADYLQIISLQDEKGLTDKAKTDKIVKGLRILARKYDAPLIAISSFNRENYNNPVSMSSFKESGGIDYGVDCLIGLQPTYFSRIDEETEAKYKKAVKKARKEFKEDKKNNKPLEVQAVVLKSRYSAGGEADFLFMSKYNLFVDSNTPTLQASPEATKTMEQIKGKAQQSSKDILKQFIEQHYKGQELKQVDYYASNRVSVRHASGQVDVFQAHEHNGAWTVHNVNTYECFNVFDTNEG